MHCKQCKCTLLLSQGNVLTLSLMQCDRIVSVRSLILRQNPPAPLWIWSRLTHAFYYRSQSDMPNAQLTLGATRISCPRVSKLPEIPIRNTWKKTNECLFICPLCNPIPFVWLRFAFREICAHARKGFLEVRGF